MICIVFSKVVRMIFPVIKDEVIFGYDLHRLKRQLGMICIIFSKVVRVIFPVIKDEVK